MSLGLAALCMQLVATATKHALACEQHETGGGENGDEVVFAQHCFSVAQCIGIKQVMIS